MSGGKDRGGSSEAINSSAKGGQEEVFHDNIVRNFPWPFFNCNFFWVVEDYKPLDIRFRLW